MTRIIITIALALACMACKQKTPHVVDAGGRAGPTTIEVIKPDMGLTLPDEAE